MQFGSGSPLLGGTQSIEQQLLARQTGQVGATSQQTPASAGYDPNAQAPAPLQGQAPGMQPDPNAGQPQTPQASMPTNEPELIIKALASRLKLLPVA